jgi:ribosomal protein L29
MTARAVALDTLRALSGEELALHLREQRGQLFQVRLQQTIGQVENHRQIRAIRKEIARTMTVQVEIRLAAERGEPAPAPRPNAAAAAGGHTRQAPAVTPLRSRRSRDAAADSAVEAAAVSADAPVEEAISDLEIERIEPQATPAKRRSGKRNTPAKAEPVSDEAESTDAGAEPDDDQQ